MFTWLHTLFDTMLPPRPEVTLARTANTRALETLINYRSFPGGYSALSYQLPVVKALIHAHKFYHDEHSRQCLGWVLSKLILNTQTNNHSRTILVPIPLSQARQRARGGNQVELIISAALPHLHALPQLTIITDLIERPHDTTPQSHLSRQERLKNLHDCFRWNNKYHSDDLRGCHVLLIDDVRTTGATLTAAKTALLPHLPADTSLTLLAIAH
jgi:ComF family protein